MDQSLVKAMLIKRDFFEENRVLINRAKLCISSQPDPNFKFLATLPCFDNNAWVSYPNLEGILASRVNNDSRFLHQTSSSSLLRSLKRSLPGLAIELVIRLFSPKFRVQKKIGAADSEIVGFTYSNFDQLDTNFFSNSKYWGPLPGWLKSCFEVTWLGLGNTRLDKKAHHDNLHLSTSFSACYKYLINFRNRWQFWKTLQSHCLDIEIFSRLKLDYRRAIIGFPAFEAEYLETMFANHIAKSSARVVLVPHENQLWERILCFTAKKNNLTVLGFLHTTPRFWDVRFFDFGQLAVFQPNFFISGGKAYEKVLSEGGVTPYRILKATALRFQHLSQVRGPRAESIGTDQTLRILVVTGVNKSASRELIKLVSRTSFPGEPKISLRPHPENTLWIARRFPRHKIEERDFETCLSEYNFFITDSVSSLGLEFASLGKRTAVFLPRYSLNFSPLFFFEDYNSYFWDEHSLSGLATTIPSKLDISEIFDLPNQVDPWLKCIRKALNG